MKDLPGVLGVIAQEAGVDAAEAVGLRLAGCQVKFPSLSRLLIRERDRRIKAELDKGRSITELARRFNLSPSQIYRIAHKKI